MNPLRNICLLMGIFALVSANTAPIPMGWNVKNSIKNSLNPTDWLSVAQLQALPPINELKLTNLEQLSVQEGAALINKMYHLSQAGHAFEPSYYPKPSEISGFLITPDNKKVNFKLNELAAIVKEQKDFGNQEVTIFITGLPQVTETVKKATRKLVQAYVLRYNSHTTEPTNQKHDNYFGEKVNPTSSEEDYSTSWNTPSGNLIVIDFGSVITKTENYLNLDIEQAGIEIGNVLVQLTNKNDIPHEIIHVIGSNVGAHVAGAAGRQYARETGQQLHRITGLDPSKIYSKRSNALTGLARDDAEFVDVIHTSAYGIGIATRSGDVDFYPDGPNEGVPGADNVVEASMRAIRYWAETVVPGNERNFPAAQFSWHKEYKNQNGYAKRVYMGINTDHDVYGDFVLQVNPKSPFGRNSPLNKHEGHHNVHNKV